MQPQGMNASVAMVVPHAHTPFADAFVPAPPAAPPACSQHLTAPLVFTSQPEQTVVVAWDLDETLIIFNSLLNGSYAAALARAAAKQLFASSDAGNGDASGPGKCRAQGSCSGTRAAGRVNGGAAPAPPPLVDLELARVLGNKVADGIFDFCDNHMAYRHVEHLDPMHITDMTASVGNSAPALFGAPPNRLQPTHLAGGALLPRQSPAQPLAQALPAPPQQQPDSQRTDYPTTLALAGTTPGVPPTSASSQLNGGPAAAGAACSSKLLTYRPSLKRSLTDALMPSASAEASRGEANHQQQVQLQPGGASGPAPQQQQHTRVWAHRSTSGASSGQVLVHGGGPSSSSSGSHGSGHTARGWMPPRHSMPNAQPPQQQQQPAGLLQQALKQSAPSRLPEGPLQPTHPHPPPPPLTVLRTLTPTSPLPSPPPIDLSSPASRSGWPAADPVAAAPPQGGALPMALGDMGQGLREDGEEAALKRWRSSDTPSGLSHAQIFAHVARMYAAGLGAMRMTQQERASLQQLHASVDNMSSGWLSAAEGLLYSTTQAAALRSCTVHHCIVTTGQLLPTLAKLMLFGLAHHFPVENVYSASKQTKLVAFKKIRARWGVRAKYLAVGDSGDEHQAAAFMKWPFIRVSLVPHPGWPPGATAAAAPPLATQPLAPRAAHAREIRSHTVLLRPLDGSVLGAAAAPHSTPGALPSTLASPVKAARPGPAAPAAAAQRVVAGAWGLGLGSPAGMAAAVKGLGGSVNPGPMSHELCPPFSPGATMAPPTAAGTARATLASSAGGDAAAQTLTMASQALIAAGAPRQAKVNVDKGADVGQQAALLGAADGGMAAVAPCAAMDEANPSDGPKVALHAGLSESSVLAVDIAALSCSSSDSGSGGDGGGSINALPSLAVLPQGSSPSLPHQRRVTAPLQSRSLSLAPTSAPHSEPGACADISDRAVAFVAVAAGSGGNSEGGSQCAIQRSKPEGSRGHVTWADLPAQQPTAAPQSLFESQALLMSRLTGHHTHSSSCGSAPELHAAAGPRECLAPSTLIGAYQRLQGTQAAVEGSGSSALGVATLSSVTLAQAGVASGSSMASGFVGLVSGGGGSEGGLGMTVGLEACELRPPPPCVSSSVLLLAVSGASNGGSGGGDKASSGGSSGLCDVAGCMVVDGVAAVEEGAAQLVAPGLASHPLCVSVSMQMSGSSTPTPSSSRANPMPSAGVSVAACGASDGGGAAAFDGAGGAEGALQAIGGLMATGMAALPEAPAALPELPEGGVSIHQLWGELVLDVALHGAPAHACQPMDE